MRKLLSILLILIICVSLVPINVNAITLGDYEKKLQEYIAEAKSKQAAINKTQKEIEEAKQQIESIKKEMQNLTEEVARLHQEIADHNEDIKQKSLQTKEIFQYFQMSNGENTYMEYVFGADSITDLIYRTAIVKQLTEYNNKVTKELEEMIEANKLREKEIETKNKQLTEKKDSLEDKIVTLGYSKQELSKGMADVQTQIKNYEERVNAFKAKGCQSHHVIGVDCDVYGSAGVFRRPVSWGYITSEFGSRWGTFHRGLDISNSNPYNTKIYPIANGTIVSKYTDWYGALVLAIEHYDTISKKYYTSLYAHMNSYAPGMYVGKFVTSDTYIGYMGNTGYSTGPHLHIEVGQCRLYVDYNCRNIESFTEYIKKQASLGYKGPRQLINFPNGTYVYWNTR